MYVDDISLAEVTATSIHPAEGIYENGDCEDKAQLLAETKAELKRRGTPAISYEADVLTLARSGMNTHNVALGDRVLLVDTTFTPDLRLSGRVLQLEENLLDPALTVITIGNIIERFTTSSRNTQQRLDRVIADTGAWRSTSQQVAQNASKWDQVAQTVVDNTGRWNNATTTVEANASRWEATTSTVNEHSADWNNTATTLQAKQDAWDRTRETLDARQSDWDATTASVAEKSNTWDNAAITAASHAQAISRSTTGGVTIHHDQLAITLGDTISLTDETGTTWTFANGAFVKQSSTE